MEYWNAGVMECLPWMGRDITIPFPLKGGNIMISLPLRGRVRVGMGVDWKSGEW
jgi:hypothetical protein